MFFWTLDYLLSPATGDFGVYVGQCVKCFLASLQCVDLIISVLIIGALMLCAIRT